MAKSSVSWLEFQQVITARSRRTRVWDVISVTGRGLGALRIRLGRVEWCRHGRGYLFKPNDALRLALDARYLRDIAGFCDGETRKRQGERVMERTRERG